MLRVEKEEEGRLTRWPSGAGAAAQGRDQHSCRRGHSAVLWDVFHWEPGLVSV